jgi:hypothetical protein
MTLAVTILFFVVYGLAKACSDGEVRNGNVLVTWKNKWLLGLGGEPVPCSYVPWYYFGLYKPEFIERFMYSSTLLTFLTDKWHRCNALMNNSMSLCAGFLLAGFTFKAILLSLFFRVVAGVIFEIKFKKR